MESTIGGLSLSTNGGSNPYYWVLSRVGLILVDAKRKPLFVPCARKFCEIMSALRSKSTVGRQSSMKNYVRLAAWALACLIFGSVSTHAQNITTVIGGGPVALPATASIGTPSAVRFDSLGNAYFLDNNFSRVIKLDHTTGLVSVFAGNGTTGFSGDGGPATNAQMNQPSGMCIDAANNLYIADSDNAVIRKVTSAGIISTFAGVPSPTNMIFGGDGGVATAANLHFPDGCSLDSAGNLYIADRSNNEIRVVYEGGTKPAGMSAITMVTGNIYKFAGGTDGAPPTPPSNNGGYAPDGTLAQSAALYGPFDVYVDTTVTPNNVYYSEIGNNYDSHGNPILTGPVNNNVIREILGTDGTIHTVAGKQGVFGADNNVAAVGAAINIPKGISVDAAGDIFFADQVNQVIREVTKATGIISVVAGQFGHHGYAGDTGPATSASLTFPSGTTLDSGGDIYIADQGSFAVRIVPAVTGGGKTAGDIYTVAGSGHLSYGGDNGPATSGELNTPAGLAVDPTGNVFIADSLNELIRVVGKTSGNLGSVAGQVENDGFLNSPVVINSALGVAADASGNVYIADTSNCLVRKLSSAGIVTIAGVEPAVPVADNSANAPICGFGTSGSVAAGTGGTGGTKLGAVNSVAVDSHGSVFFSDQTNSVIWEVPAVTVGTLEANNAYIVAGTRTAGFAGDGGAATAAQLSGPTGIYIDIYNNLFIADAGNHRIREVPAINVTTPTAMTAGSIYTIAGNGTSGSTGNGGAATSAEIATPFAIVVDHAENVYFSDTTNQTVRKVNNATGNISTVAGTNGTAGFLGDGALATSAQLNVPQGLGLLADVTPNTTFDLLISDSQNNRVRSVAALASNAAVPLVSFSQNPLVFTAEPQSTASAPVPITITNTGGASLSISGFSFGGANAGDFTEGTTTCTGTPVAANGTCTVNVIFTPSALGTRNATIIVASNAFGAPSAALTGTGGTPTATLNPTSLTFASTTVGTAAPTQTVTLSNTGNAATIVTGITFTGTNAGDYSETDNCVSAVGGIPVTTGTCTITVTFKPAAVGASTATMTVASNVAGANTVALSGTGASPVLSLKVQDTDASSTQTVTAGATATYNLSVSGNQSVTATITCTGAPTDATCSATPASVAVTAAAAGTFKLTITTTARSQMVPFNQPSMKIQPPTFLQVAPLASLALLFVIAMMLGWMQNQAGRARTLRLAMSLCLILMPIVASTVLVGCGGGSSSTPPPPVQTGTPAGTYAITVTATSGSTTSTAALTLVVQ
jgi:sugar lactone lactonase YvrE